MENTNTTQRIMVRKENGEKHKYNSEDNDQDERMENTSTTQRVMIRKENGEKHKYNSEDNDQDGEWRTQVQLRG